MARAMAALDPKPQLALIDGNRAADFGLPVRTVVKGDSLSASIAAASILAEVHKGYGTKRHYEALRAFGPCEIHRKTFLKKFYENA